MTTQTPQTDAKQRAALLIAKAKAGLIIDSPFFASLILSMPVVESTDPDVSTAATNGLGIEYNAEYVASLQLPEVTFLLAHETAHCAFEHCLTIGDKNPNRWNSATDYVINDILVREKIGVMPKGGLLDAALVAKGNGHAEGVYKLLPKETENKKPGSKGGAMDSLKKGAKDAADQKQKSAEMKVKVLQAKNAAKMMGKLSAGLEKLVSEVTRTETPWREVLRRFFTERAKLDFSFARPKRRFLADDIYLPSLIGEKLGRIAVLVDCSGSAFDDITLKTFSGEINGIREDAGPSETMVIYFDTQVLRTETFGPDDTFKLNPIGGGGTAYSPIFAALEKLDEKPIACVVLTDLCCSDFGPVPSFPVLWASTRRGSAPFGEITYLKGGAE